MNPLLHGHGRALFQSVALAATLLVAGAPCSRQPAPAPIKVVFFTDVHARPEWHTPQALAQAAAAINAENADLVICGGDMITEGITSTPRQVAARWEVYLAMHRAIRPEPICAIGNHDLVGVRPTDGSPPADDPRTDYRARLGRNLTYQSFDFRGIHIFLLDPIEVTDDESYFRGFVGPEQMHWLRTELARLPPDKPLILVSHLPLATVLYQLTDGATAPVEPHRVIVNNREVLALFEGRRLLAVLQGHLHVEEHLRWRGITFISGGAICGRWWRGAFFGTPPGYGVLWIHPDRVEWQYRPLPWTPRRPPNE